MSWLEGINKSPENLNNSIDKTKDILDFYWNIENNDWEKLDTSYFNDFLSELDESTKSDIVDYFDKQKNNPEFINYFKNPSFFLPEGLSDFKKLKLKFKPLENNSDINLSSIKEIVAKTTEENKIFALTFF